MRQDDRGITLLETIIAITIAVIVMGAATLFLRNALRGFQLASETINLKVEAQVLMEQFSTWVMEGNYCEFNEDKGEGLFVIYHIPREAPGTMDQNLMGKCWMKVFRHTNGNLYVYEEEFDLGDGGISRDDIIDMVNSPVTWQESWPMDQANLISDCVEEFDVNIARSGEGSSYKVTVTMLMQLGSLKYELKDEINMRNEAFVPATTSADTP